MKSKTQLKKQIKRKTNSNLVETLQAALKQKAWLSIAGQISGPTRKYSSVNLDEIEANSKEGDIIIVPGKVLGRGNVSKKIRICALSFASTAREKLKKSKSEIMTIAEEIKHNPKAQGLKVLS